MATRIIHELISDIDGKPADETVSFSLDGQAYEIDVTEAQGFKLRNMLQSYIVQGRKVPKDRPAAVKPQPVSAVEFNRAARKWLQANGWQLGDKGIIAKHLKEAYLNKTPGPGVELAAPEPEPVTVPVVVEELAAVEAPQKPATAPRKTTPKKATTAAPKTVQEPVKTVVPPTARTRKAATTNNVVEAQPPKKTVEAAQKPARTGRKTAA